MDWIINIYRIVALFSFIFRKAMFRTRRRAHNLHKVKNPNDLCLDILQHYIIESKKASFKVSRKRVGSGYIENNGDVEFGLDWND